MINRVTKGPPRTRTKLNEIIDHINRQSRAVGDEFIHRRQAGGASVVGLASDVLQPHIPRRRGGGTGTGSGLLAWYQFNGNANDSSANGNDGTFTGGMTAPLNVAEFDGDDDYVDCGSDFIGTLACTIVAWIRPVAWGESNQGRILDNATTVLSLLSTTSGLFFVSDGATIASSANSSITLHQWTQVAVTRTAAGVCNFYVNGILSGDADQASGTPAAGTTNVCIGNRTAQDRTFDGAMDDVRIYNKVLTAAQIRSLHANDYRFHHQNQTFGACKVFEVQSAGTGDGIYNCYEQTLDATEWADTAGDAKFSDRNTTSTEVLNLAEFDPEATYVAQLAAGDMLLAFRVWDDEAGARWYGMPLRKGAQGGAMRLAYVKTTPAAVATVACYLDTDATGTEITVTCHICGGSALNSAFPRLTDGDEIFVTKLSGTWYCVTTFQTSEECVCSV